MLKWLSDMAGEDTELSIFGVNEEERLADSKDAARE